MGVVRKMLLWGSRNRWLENQFRRRRFAQKAVSRFVPGEDVDSALTASARLSERGITAVLTQLGENVTTLAEAEAVTNHYLQVLDKTRNSHRDTHISIKLTQLGLDLDPAAATNNLEELVRHASSLDNVVWVDMESSEYVDATLEAFRTVRTKHDNVGLCLQTYLYRTPADLKQLLEIDAAIRLVKGAYQEPPAVAMPRKRDVDAAFLELATQLVEHAARGAKIKPGIGTHDTRLLADLQRVTAERGWRRDTYEVQMLYGIRRLEQERLAAASVPVRVLVSYGDAWFTWYMRRLAERPANVGFVLRSMFA